MTGTLGLGWVQPRPGAFGRHTPEWVPALICRDHYLPLHASGPVDQLGWHAVSLLRRAPRGVEWAQVPASVKALHFTRVPGPGPGAEPLALRIDAAADVLRDARAVMMPGAYLSETAAFQAGFLITQLERTYLE